MMTNTKPELAYVNLAGLLTHAGPAVKEILQNYNYDWEPFIDHCSIESMSPYYCRTGKNLLPFKNKKIIELLDCIPPIRDENYSKTFSDISDQRSHDMIALYNDRPWFIPWSGGLDSTVIVVSLIKNLKRSELANITVLCNRASVYESPEFFYKHILPNFAVKDYHNVINKESFGTHYIIDGNPADLLYGHPREQETMGNYINYTKPWRSQTDFLISSFRGRGFSKRTAEWLYNIGKEHIDSANVPITSVFEFFWWQRFSHGWISCKLRNGYGVHYRDYFKTKIGWYDNSDYQQWAIHNNFGNEMHIFRKNPNDYKGIPKLYIHDFDNNSMQLHFKTKTQSQAHNNNLDYRNVAILDNFDQLNAFDDLDQILELLPNHIQNT